MKHKKSPEKFSAQELLAIGKVRSDVTAGDIRLKEVVVRCFSVTNKKSGQDFITGKDKSLPGPRKLRSASDVYLDVTIIFQKRIRVKEVKAALIAALKLPPDNKKHTDRERRVGGGIFALYSYLTPEDRERQYRGGNCFTIAISYYKGSGNYQARKDPFDKQYPILTKNTNAMVRKIKKLFT